MFLRQIFDPYLAQYAYLVGCPQTGEALIIDPERDVDRYREVARQNGLVITAVAETHIHADFVSGARELAEDPAIQVYLSGEGGSDWSYRWPGSRPHTHFLRHGSRFKVGNLEIEVVHTPGHTPEHLCYLITDRGAGEPIALATGDFIFVGDVGRPDLLETAVGVAGSMPAAARQLRESLCQRLAPYAEYLQLLPGHGAGSSCGKSLGAIPTTTLGYERRHNPALLLAQADQQAFVTSILSGQPEPPSYFARMKQVNRDGGAVSGGAPGLPPLTATAFVELAGKPSVRVVDARGDREAFAGAHFPGALHAPMRSSFFAATVGSYVDSMEPILLVLDKPEDADLASRSLYRIGYDLVSGWIAAKDVRGLFSARLSRVDFADFDPAQARVTGEIIDVRTGAEFAEGHLEGAISLPYTRLKSRLGELPRDRALFIHCGSGKRAALAAAFLQAEGFEVVHVDGICAECEEIARASGMTH